MVCGRHNRYESKVIQVQNFPAFRLLVEISAFSRVSTGRAAYAEFGFSVWGLTHGERGARTYNGGLGAVPPAGSRGRAPGGGSGGLSPLKLKTFRVLEFERSYILTTNLLYLPLL